MLKETIHVNGIEYSLIGDYYVPNIPLSDEEIGVGFYGRKRLNFMREHRQEEYEKLLRSNTLHDYLKEFEQQVQKHKRELLSQYLLNEQLIDQAVQNSSWAWLRKVHLIYTEIDVVIRAEYVYA